MAFFEAFELSMKQQWQETPGFFYMFNGEDDNVVAHEWLLSCQQAFRTRRAYRVYQMHND